jgi:glycerol-3-phosphate dehydrogenase
MKNKYDIVIIGGGINGCAIAADAQMRGLSVALCEKYDLAQGTSSHSSKLIHGGLRYLESYQFSLVRKALKEREILLKVCPHLITPQPFILPFDKNLRPYWLLRTGLYLYDNLYQSQLPKTLAVNEKQHPQYFSPLSHSFERGFCYYDAKTNDARLVIANALQARKYGADIFLHTEVYEAKCVDDHWQVHVKQNGEYKSINANVLINAAGPEVMSLSKKLKISTPYTLSLVKGSHIVVPKLYQGDHAYLLQNRDKRVVFAIPFNDEHTLVGTTEETLANYSPPNISHSETHYLCEIINTNFKHQIKPVDIVHTLSGIRPLINTNAEYARNESRDYKIHTDFTRNNPSITLFGGKITTYRMLAKETLDSLKQYFPHMKDCQTDKIPLPGSQFDSFDQFKKEISKQYSWLPENLKDRYLRLYGSNICTLLGDKQSLSQLGKSYNKYLYDCEITYLKDHEWASSIDDILFRRTNLILNTSMEEREQLEKELFN